MLEQAYLYVSDKCRYWTDSLDARILPDAEKNFAEFLPQTSEAVVLSAAASSKPVNEDLYRKVKAGAFWNAGPSGSVCRQ